MMLIGVPAAHGEGQSRSGYRNRPYAAGRTVLVAGLVAVLLSLHQRRLVAGCKKLSLREIGYSC